MVNINQIMTLYDKFNRLYFGGQLPHSSESDCIDFRLSNTKACAGSCRQFNKLRYGKRIGVAYQISISQIYHVIYPQDLESTLLHEMIHMKIWEHGKKFKQEMKRIQDLGGDVSYRCRSLKSILGKQYVCTSCGSTARTLRSFNVNKYKCVKCGGRFRAREYRK